MHTEITLMNSGIVSAVKRKLTQSFYIISVQ